MAVNLVGIQKISTAGTRISIGVIGFVIIEPMMSTVVSPVLAQSAETLADITSRSGEVTGTDCGVGSVEGNANGDWVVLVLLTKASLGLLATGHDVGQRRRVGNVGIAATVIGIEIESFICSAAQEGVVADGSKVVNVLFTSIEKVGDFSALVVKAEILLTLAHGETLRFKAVVNGASVAEPTLQTITQVVAWQSVAGGQTGACVCGKNVHDVHL